MEKVCEGHLEFEALVSSAQDVSIKIDNPEQLEQVEPARKRLRRALNSED